MFSWWTTKTESKDPVKPRISVSQINGQVDVQLTQDVTPTEYIDFLAKVLDNNMLTQASILFELNGHKNAMSAINSALIAKYTAANAVLTDKIKETYANTEIVKPSKGLLGYE